MYDKSLLELSYKKTMNNLAFLISCEEYSRKEVENLLGVKEDVQKIRNALIQHFGVLEANCHYLCDSQGIDGAPTGLKLMDLLRDWRSPEEYNTIFFYFSGHGFLSRDNELCIMTSDSILDPFPLRHIKLSDIVEVLKQYYDYKYIVFILDMCQTYRNDAKGAIDIEFPYGIITICSCLPGSESYLLPEGEGRGSIFTHCFVKALEMSNEDSTINEIVEDTRKRMIEIDKHYDYGQICYLATQYYDLGNITLRDFQRNKESRDKKQSEDKSDTDEEPEKYISYIPEIITNFCGRERELQFLQKKIDSSDDPIFISGDGGIGKTMLMLRFSELHSEYKYCFAVFHTSMFHTIASIKFSNHLIYETDDKNLSEKQLYKRNMQLLEGYGDKLVLLIDNFDSENYDRTFFELVEQKPDSNMGEEFKNKNIFERLKKFGVHIIITTRLKVPKSKQSIDIEQMNSKTLIKFIVSSCDSIYFNQHAKDTLEEIIKAIKGLTIIVNLIISVLQKQRSLEALYELADIILNEKYQKHEINIDSAYDLKNTTIFNHIQSVFNFLDLAEEDKEMLRIVSLLPYGGISIKLFFDLNRINLSAGLTKTIYSLNDLRLINISANHISMHPVISTFVKFELRPDANNCKKFLASLLGAYHTDAIEEYGKSFIEEICLTLEQAAKRIDDPQMKTELYSKAGIIARRSGMYTDSKRMELMAISTLESEEDPDYKDLATCHSNIANLFLDMADLDSAERHQGEAIRIRKKIFGENHPDTAMSYCNMALICSQRAKYQDAIRYQEKAIRILENAPDCNPLSLAIAYANMAQISYDQGFYEEALNWEKKALKIRKDFLDDDSHYLAVSYNNISLYFCTVGKVDKAEAYARKAIGIQMRILGPSHPYLAISYSNLASALKAKGDYLEAIEYQRMDIKIKEDRDEENHWNTATSFDNLAELQILTHNFNEAKSSQEKAINIREKVQGETHPDLAKSYGNMITILENLEDLEGASYYRSKLAHIIK